MSIEAIQPHKYGEDRADLLKTTLIGAAAGYGLKWAIPVAEHERGDVYKNFRAAASEQVKKVKLNAIESIRTSSQKTPAMDEFIKMVDSADGVKVSKIKALSETTAKGVKEVLEYVQDAGKTARKAFQKEFNKFTKQIRPSGAFIAIGAGVALATGLVYNALSDSKKS